MPAAWKLANWPIGALPAQIEVACSDLARLTRVRSHRNCIKHRFKASRLGAKLSPIGSSKTLMNTRVLTPDENHWILKPRNSKQWYGEVFDWLGAHGAGRKI